MTSLLSSTSFARRRNTMLAYPKKDLLRNTCPKHSKSLWHKHNSESPNVPCSTGCDTLRWLPFLSAICFFSASSLVLAPVGPEHKRLTFPSKGITEPLSKLMVDSVLPLQLLPYLQCSQAMQANAVESVEQWASALSLMSNVPRSCAFSGQACPRHFAIDHLYILHDMILSSTLDGYFVDLLRNPLNFEHPTSYWHDRNTRHLLQSFETESKPIFKHGASANWCETKIVSYLERPFGFFSLNPCRWCKQCSICVRLLLSGCNRPHKCPCADKSASGNLSSDQAPRSKPKLCDSVLPYIHM